MTSGDAGVQELRELLDRCRQTIGPLAFGATSGVEVELDRAVKPDALARILEALAELPTLQNVRPVESVIVPSAHRCSAGKCPAT